MLAESSTVFFLLERSDVVCDPSDTEEVAEEGSSTWGEAEEEGFLDWKSGAEGSSTSGSLGDARSRTELVEASSAFGGFFVVVFSASSSWPSPSSNSPP